MRPLHTPKPVTINSRNISSLIPGERTSSGASLSTLIYLKGVAKYLKCQILLPKDKPMTARKIANLAVAQVKANQWHSGMPQNPETRRMW
jgi:hypothetical protein